MPYLLSKGELSKTTHPLNVFMPQKGNSFLVSSFLHSAVQLINSCYHLYTYEHFFCLKFSSRILLFQQ